VFRRVVDGGEGILQGVLRIGVGRALKTPAVFCQLHEKETVGLCSGPTGLPLPARSGRRRK